MSGNAIVYTKPLLSTHSLRGKVFLSNKNADQGSIYRKSLNREFIGKYCLVDWLDDRAIIDCSLIHEWD
jgi:hypothetical protein